MRSAACILAFALLGCSDSTVSEPNEFGDATLRWADIGKSCDESSPAVLLSDVRRDSLRPNFLGPVGTQNRDWADAAREIPGGVGGIFLENGTPYLYLVDPSKRAEAIAGLAARPIATGFPLQQAQVRQGRWDFAQLGDWYGYLNLRGVMSRDLISADIQEARNRLEYGVPSEEARRALESWLASIGISCNLVAISIERILIAH